MKSCYCIKILSVPDTATILVDNYLRRNVAALPRRRGSWLDSLHRTGCPYCGPCTRNPHCPMSRPSWNNQRV